MGDWMTKINGSDNEIEEDIVESLQFDSCSPQKQTQIEDVTIDPLRYQNDDKILTNMETEEREVLIPGFVLNSTTADEDPLLLDDCVDISNEGEGVVEGSDIFSSAADPWLPLVPGTGVVESPDQQSQEQDTSRVTEWLLQVEDSPLDSTSDSSTITMAPATNGEALQSAGASKKNQLVAVNKTPKEQNQKIRKSTEMCQHLVKATSMPGIRKALKGDIKNICAFRPSCNIGSIASKSSTDSTPLMWMCLQCGNIGCGDIIAQGGHAEKHYKTPRSDFHYIAVLFQGELDKVWCFECNFELDANSTFFKDCLTFLRRSVKVKTALNSNLVIPTTPIALGPPPPPPVPKLDPPKQFSLKGKQNKNSSSSSSNRWDNGDWPLGLDNLGNTCFMNSALQCLSRTRSLTDKLDLHGAGNIIEILVTSDEPYVQIINDNAEQEGSETNSVSDECDKFIERSLRSTTSTGVDSSELESALSPSSTDMDSLLDVASGTSNESEGSGDAVDKEKWAKELDHELRKPLRLRFLISKESMAAKLRHCFKAITRTPDSVPNEDSHDRSEFYYRNSNYPTVFSPRAVHFALSRNFRPGQQHDSHELLRTVVDMMKKDQIKAFRLAIMERYGVKKSEGKNCDPKVAELLKMWDRKLYHKTFVDEIFGGELVTTQKCLQCESVRRSHEEFLDLSLPIRVFRANANPSKKSYSLFDDDHDSVINRSVEDCLLAYTEPEFLTGSNVVECENCHRINLEKLAAGAELEDVFPGNKQRLEPQPNSSEDKLAEKSKHQQKKQNKKRQPRQAKIKAKLDQTNFIQSDSGMDVGSSLRIVDDYFKSDKAKFAEKSTNTTSEEDAKSSKSGSLDDYVIIQSTPMVKEPERLAEQSEMDMDFDLPFLEPCASTIAGEQTLEGVDNIMASENDESNLSRELSTSLNNLKFIEHGMDIDGCGGEEQEMITHGENDDEDMDDLDEPAVDGVGNASDIEDEEGNGLVPLDLGFPDEKSVGAGDYLSVPVSTGNTVSTVVDEGFGSEGSLEGKNSQSLSASSSRNSISEVENVESSSQANVKKIPVTKCPCSRQQLISRPPDCLTLHLKRFQHTGRGSSKLNDRVTFSYILNLTEFCSEAGEDVTKPGYKSIFDEDGEVVYSLYGIVEHSGSLHFGHYVAYVKVAGKEEESGQRAPDKWFYISDSHVSSSSLRSVLTQEAYILFYERIRGPEKRERLSHLRNLNNGEASTYDGSFNNAVGWASSSVSYSYDKPSAVSIGPQWDENWEDASSQQVTSSNDTESVCAADSVSSSTLSYPIIIPLPGPLSGVDGVSSTTDADIDVMDYSGPVNTSMSVHPVWDSETVQESSEVFDNSSDFMDANLHPVSMYGAVSSSSDIDRSPLTKLEEVD